MLEQTALSPCKKCNRDEKHLERFSTDEWCCISCPCGFSGPIESFGGEADAAWNRVNSPDDLDDEIDHEAEEKYWYRRDEQG